jgi:type II secretion system protein H
VTRRSTGFTLLELMVVIAVLGILATLVVPQFQGTFEDARLKAAARELLAVLKLARSEAVSLQEVVCLCIDPAENKYWLEAPSGQGGGAGQGEAMEPLMHVPGSSGRVQAQISLTTMEEDRGGLRGAAERPRRPPRGDVSRFLPERILFRPDGTADGASILLRNPGGPALVLRIHAVTGRVRTEVLREEEIK